MSSSTRIVTRRSCLRVGGAVGLALLSACASPSLATPPTASSSMGQALSATPQPRKVKVASVLTSTLNAAFLLDKYLRPEGVEAEVVLFPNITERMQAIANGSAQIGYGGLTAAIILASKGFPLTVLANACDGGWEMVARQEIGSIRDLRGKKIATQSGTPADLTVRWKLKQEGLDPNKDLEIVFMDNPQTPVALQKGACHARLGTSGG